MRAADVLLRLDHGEVVGSRRAIPDGIVGLDLADEIEPDAPAVLELKDVVKTFERGGDAIHAVDHASFSVREGEMVGLVGRSGSGKTTLLNIVAGWEQADRGRIDGVGGTPPWHDLAVVPQRLGLIDELTVRENVAYPAKLEGTLHEHEDRIGLLLEELGLSHLADRRPFETSVGEQQRTALLRALLLRPRLVVADEPTGHQDRGWTEKVFASLRAHCDEGTACLVATHDETSKRFLNRTLSMHDGRIETSA
jgi:putative ABC transport system ATP-binding protein